MYHQKVILALITTALLLAACSGQEIPASPSLESATMTPIPPTETATITPSPIPTSTPTLTPTPTGGKSSLLLVSHSCHRHTAYYTTDCKIYTYDLNAQTGKSLLTGYSLAGVSPDGKTMAIQRIEGEKADLFVADLSNPRQLVLLYEDVMSYQSVWFPGTDWIGFIAKADGKPQVFIIHPDGSDLTQVTNSAVGAVWLMPVFRDGVLWGEARLEANGFPGPIKRYVWTKLDGTEKSFIGVMSVAPSGKYVVTELLEYTADCPGCTFVSTDLTTGETKEVTLSKPDAEVDFLFPRVQPLSDDKWLVVLWPSRTTAPRYFIYSSDGKLLLDFSTLPYEQETANKDAVILSYHKAIGADGGDLSGQRLSPDGNWFMIAHEQFINADDGDQYFVVNGYYLLNVSTYEIQPLGEIRINNTVVRLIEGVNWIDLP